MYNPEAGVSFVLGRMKLLLLFLYPSKLLQNTVKNFRQQKNYDSELARTTGDSL